jgi:hypothetical protein
VDGSIALKARGHTKVTDTANQNVIQSDLLMIEENLQSMKQFQVKCEVSGLGRGL